MRSTELREAKAELRRWFASQPTEYLTRVVDECRAGGFAFSHRCSCVRGLCPGGYKNANSERHLAAEIALGALAGVHVVGHYYSTLMSCMEVRIAEANYDSRIVNHLARARTLPIVLAEIRRRNRVRVPEAVEVQR